MGGIFPGVTVVGGSLNSPGIPFALSPLSGLFSYDNRLGLGISGADVFDIGTTGGWIGSSKTGAAGLVRAAGSPFVLPAVTAGNQLFTPDGLHVISLNGQNNSVLYVNDIDPVTGVVTNIRSFNVAGSQGGTAVISIHPSGKWLAVMSTNNLAQRTVQIWSIDPVTANLANISTTNLSASYASFSNNGLYLAVYDSFYVLTVYNFNESTGAIGAATGNVALTNGGQANPVWSPDSTQLAVPSYVTNGLYIFNISNTGVPSILQLLAPVTLNGGQTPSYSASGAWMIISNTTGSFQLYATGSAGYVLHSTYNNIATFSGAIFSVDEAHIYLMISGGVTPQLLDIPFDVLSGNFGASTQYVGFTLGSWSPAINKNHLVYSAGTAFLESLNFSATPSVPLIGMSFDVTGKSYGSVNINGTLTVKNSVLLSKSIADSYYAALAGLGTQIFSAANAVPGTQNVVPIIQADARYASINGNGANVFLVANASLGTQEAVPRIQADAMYAAIAGLNTQVFSASGFKASEAANQKQGVAVLAAGTVTVANTSITVNSRIFLTSQVDGGAPGFLRVSARVAGTSFTILSSSNTDTSTVAYEIFEPA